MATAVAAVASLAGAAFGGGSILKAVASIAFSTGLSWLSSELAPEPASPAFTQSGRALSFRSEAANRPILFGRTQVSGAPTFVRTSDEADTPLFNGTDGRILHMCIPLAGHPVAGMPRVWFGDQLLDIDVDGNVLGDFTGHMVVKRHLGHHNQAADPDLIATFGDLDANFRGRLVAYIYVALKRSNTVYPQGLQNFSVECDGALYFDPRDPSQTADDPLSYRHGRNAELCTIHYMRGCPMLNANAEVIRPYGLALQDTAFGNWIDVAAEAAICDEDIPLKAGGTEKRYQLNGRISTEETPRNELPRLMTAMAGRLVHQPERWSVRAGVARVPVAHLDRRYTRGDSLTIQSAQGSAKLFTEVQGKYINGESYKEESYPRLRVPALERPGVPAERLSLHFPYTNSPSACQRLGKIAIMQASKQKALTSVFTYRLYDLVGSDWVTWTDGYRSNWSNIPMEIGPITFATYPSDASEGGLALALEITLQETGPEVFAWDPIEEEGEAHLGVGAIVPNAMSVPTPTFLDIEVLGFDQNAVVELTSGPSSSDLPVTYRFSIRRYGINYFEELADQRSPVFVARNIPPGLHTFRVEAVNRLGRRSAPLDTEVMVGPPPVINQVTGLELVGQGGDLIATGPDFNFGWRRGSLNDTGFNNPDGADLFDGDDWFAGYQVRILGGDRNGPELRSLTTMNEHYAYRLDDNRRDARRLGHRFPYRQVTIEVTQRGKWGQEYEYSEPGVLTVTNPAPSEVTSISPVPMFKYVRLDFDFDASDGDVAGVIIRSSDTSGFDAQSGGGAVAYQGELTRQVDLDAIEGETQYFQIALYDEFGTENLNWSSEFAVTSLSLADEVLSPEIVSAIERGEAAANEYGVRIEAGEVKGFALIKEDGEAEVVTAAWLVDQFKIAKPGEEPKVVFEVDTQTGQLRVNSVISASITADEFNGHMGNFHTFIGKRVMNDAAGSVFDLNGLPGSGGYLKFKLGSTP